MFDIKLVRPAQNARQIARKLYWTMRDDGKCADFVVK